MEILSIVETKNRTILLVVKRPDKEVLEEYLKDYKWTLEGNQQKEVRNVVIVPEEEHEIQEERCKIYRRFQKYISEIEEE